MDEIDVSRPLRKLDNHFRYLVDPLFHYAVDLLTQVTVDAVERADKDFLRLDDRRTQREVRLQAVRAAMIEHSI